MVLTGYNTDIEHGGTTYHVQTEDKGRSNPIVESLVYARGEILFSKRTSYQELVDEKVGSDAVASLMDRQHRSIIDNIRQGRLEHLGRETGEIDDEDDTEISGGRPRKADAPGGSGESSLDQVILDYLAAQRGRAHLVLRSVGDAEFVYGREVDIAVSAVESETLAPLPGVRISVVYKSTAEPRRLELAEGRTDDDGTFSVTAALPEFAGGTSAVVIDAECELGQSEIKHLVQR